MKKIKPYFLRKIKIKKFKCLLLQYLFGALRVKLLRTDHFINQFFQSQCKYFSPKNASLVIL